MNKILPLITFLLLVITSYSQSEYKQHKLKNGVLIEYKIEENHQDDIDIHQEYIVVKITNTNNSQKTIYFDIMTDFGKGQFKYNRESTDMIILDSGESRVGNINTKEMVIFNRFLEGNNGKVAARTKLKEFEINITKIR